MNKPTQRLSKRLKHWSEKNSPAERDSFDAIVIGSGYGGAVAARRLSEKGYRVLVLERGSEFLPGEFPADVSTLPTFSRINRPDNPGLIGRSTGVMTWHVGAGFTAMVGNGLGGGSLINAGIMIKPKSSVFGQAAWPVNVALSQEQPGLSLEQAFGKAHETLLSRPDRPPAISLVRSDNTPKSHAFNQLAEHLDLSSQVRPVDATIDADLCIQCGDCATGCNVTGAKLTLADTYLAYASKVGAQILTGANVSTVHRGGDGRWTVRVVPTERIDITPDPISLKLDEISLQADLVVLAAGTFGSTEILQRSRARHQLSLSPTLGTRLSANGDSISVLANWPGSEQTVNAVNRQRARNADKQPVGATITRMIDLRNGGPINTQLLIQDGAVPAAIARLFDNLISTQWISGQLDEWRTPKLVNQEPETKSKDQDQPANRRSDPMGAPASLGDQSQILLVMGHDDSRGRIFWMPEADRAVPVWSSPEKAPTWRTQQALFDRIQKKVPGVRHLHNPLWKLLPNAASVMQGGAPDPMITTVHPLGGCVMGDSFETAVVDDRGRVRSGVNSLHQGLWVLDGAIVPTSLGCNPLLTITALAERSMSLVEDAPAPRAAALKTDIDQTAPDLTADTTSATTPPPAPEPLIAEQEPRIGAVLYERLICQKLRLSKRFASLLDTPSDTAEAEVALGFAHHDWDSALANSDHHLTEISGTLKIQSANGQCTERYRLLPTVPPDTQSDSIEQEKSSFIILSDSAVNARLNHWSRRGPRFILTFITWVVLRAIPDLSRSRSLANRSLGANLYRAVTKLSYINRKRIGRLLRILWHASEARKMQYQLHFFHDRTIGPVGKEQKHQPPSQLWLYGSKHVQYAADLREWWQWLGDRIPRALRTLQGKPAGRVRPSLKRTYIEQICNPDIRITMERPKKTGTFRLFGKNGLFDLRQHKPAGTGHFVMDPYAMLQEKPPQINEYGDLTQAIQTMAGYPALFARFALKTRLFDFRAPDYSGQVIRDNAPPKELGLRWTNTDGKIRCVQPQAYDCVVNRGNHATEDLALAEQKITLKLWRYRRVDEATPEQDEHSSTLPLCQDGSWCGQPVRRVRSVLLMHAFSQSGYCYTFKQTRQNLAEAFLAAGYEVWILESRMSTRLAISHQACSVDQIAQHDVPGAVRQILNTLEQDFKAEGKAGHDIPLQIGCFAQCIGAASLSMALLSGRLNHPRNHGLPARPLLSSIMLSQVHPLIVGARGSQAKSWIPPLLRLGMDNVPFAVRGPVDSPIEALTDRVFASLPVPDEEQCPETFNYHTHEDNVATCRRIRFIEAPLFKHRNLNSATHDQLNRLFGNANLTLFAHARRFVDYEMLVDEDGRNLYLQQSNMREQAALPIAFMHGQENELFDPQSAQRSQALYQKIHPVWAKSFADQAIMIEGYGHVDVLIGQDAADDVYPQVIDFFNRVNATAEQGATAEQDQNTATPIANAAQSVPCARYPRIGPILGLTKWSADGKTLQARVAFVVQDSSRSAIDSGPQGTTAWAYIPGQTPQAMALSVFDRHTMMACTDIQIPASLIDRNNLNISIQLVVIHDHDQSGRVDLSRHEIVCAMREQRREFRTHRLAAAAPIPNSASRRWRAYPGSASSFAGDEAVWRRPVIIRRDVIDALERPGIEVDREKSFTFALGTCRYPGMGIDRMRADAPFGKLLQLYRNGPRTVDSLTQAAASPVPPPQSPQPPAMMMMLGDQIYADSTGGMLDPATPTERFTERYNYAFGLGNSPNTARLLRTVPVLMTPDDHEFRNGWPHEGPIMAEGNEEKALHTAQSMLSAYQCLTNPLQRAGSYFLDVGPCRFCVLDTRSRRSELHDDIVPADELVKLEQWIKTAGERFICLFTGTVLLPRLRDGTSPANPAAVPDGFERAAHQREAILDMCVNHAAGRFALISGDYHVASAVQIHRVGHAEPVGCAIVAPPLYAPLRYINSLAHEVMQSDQIKTATTELEVRPCQNPQGNSGELAPLEGSGYALASVTRHQGGWQIQVSMQLNQYEAYTGWQPLRTIAEIKLKYQ